MKMTFGSIFFNTNKL